MDRNAVAEQKIRGIDPQLKTERDLACSLENEVLFWKGRFTYEQAQSLRGDGSVKAVLTNIEAEADKLEKINPAAQVKKSKRPVKPPVKQSDAVSGTPIPRFILKRFRWHNSITGPGLYKRNELTVWRKVVDDVGLNFLATAPGNTIEKFYTQYIDAGSNVLVIMIDSGFPSNFVGMGDQARILSRNSDYLESHPGPDEDALGACTIDKIGGIDNGVAWENQFALYESYNAHTR